MKVIVRAVAVIFSGALALTAPCAWCAEPLAKPGHVLDDVRGSITSVQVVTNWFMEHPTGDPLCVHCRIEHPQGDPNPLECIHWVAPHASDPTTVPCVHCRLQHSEGDDTGKHVPCIHRDRSGRPEHPGGDPVRVPCVHVQCDHPNGDPGPPGPCLHAKIRQHGHDDGPPKPCSHKVCEHPNGDQGKTTQCVHPLRPVEENLADGYRLFIADNDLRNFVKQSILDLKNRFGIYVGRPRVLNVFNHPPASGFPADGSNPNWSQYDPITHSIQLMKGASAYSLAETFRHEAGHALNGRRVVQILTPTGQHVLCTDKGPGLAMSEGWADFVGLVLSPGKEREYIGKNWEDAHLDKNCPYDVNNEFRVAAILWDIYDGNQEGGDRLNLSFNDMYKVFSPSMATLRDGPVFTSIDEYMSRLNANFGGRIGQDLANIRTLNLTPPKTR